jgi:hypothetical protein
MRVIGVTGTYPADRLGAADWTIPGVGALGVTVLGDRDLDIHIDNIHIDTRAAGGA